MEPERNVIPMPVPENIKSGSGNVTPFNRNTAAVVSDDGASGGSVDKIRDILFGAQMREYDRRFARLEDRLGNMEECVTSNEFELRRELKKLES